MIAYLKGILAVKEPDHVVVDVNGVGYRVFIPLSTYGALPAPGEGVQLLVLTHVREDAFHLYGFLTPDERQLFSVLQSVSGIGTKLALAALSALSPAQLIQAILHDDVTTLCRIAGVGKRTAQRMAMELKEKVSRLGVALPAGGAKGAAGAGEGSSTTGASALGEDIISALTNLGYKRAQVEPAVVQVLESGVEDVAAGIRAALKRLMPGG